MIHYFQAIELSAESLSNVKFIQEKKLIGRYFDQISQDTGKYCFGIEDTLRALEMGAVETLICWENLDVQRYTLKNSSTGEEKILHLSAEQEKDVTHFQVNMPTYGLDTIFFPFSSIYLSTFFLPNPDFCSLSPFFL